MYRITKVKHILSSSRMHSIDKFNPITASRETIMYGTTLNIHKFYTFANYIAYLTQYLASGPKYIYFIPSSIDDSYNNLSISRTLLSNIIESFGRMKYSNISFLCLFLTWYNDITSSYIPMLKLREGELEQCIINTIKCIERYKNVSGVNALHHRIDIDKVLKSIINILEVNYDLLQEIKLQLGKLNTLGNMLTGTIFFFRNEDIVTMISSSSHLDRLKQLLGI